MSSALGSAKPASASTRRPFSRALSACGVTAGRLASGTHTGSHPRMPQPTGRRFEVEQIWIFTLDRGKVSEISAVSDRLGLFAQLGWDWPS
jgi:hypothetical protein